MRPSSHAVRRKLREASLWVGASLGVMCLLLGALALVFDVRPLVFQSGSMAPEIEAGAVALAREVPASDLAVGDVVSVVDDRDVRVTHRIVGLERTADGAALRLQGDANASPDAQTYQVDRAYRVFVDVPWLGHVVSVAGSTWGLLLCGAFVMFLLVTAFHGRSGGDDSQADPPGTGSDPGTDERAQPGVSSVVAGLLVGSVLLGGSGHLAPLATAAAFTDTANVTSGLLAAGSVPAPVASCGVLNVGVTRVTWTAVPGATGYVLHYGAGGATTETVGPSTTTKSFTGLISNGEFSVEAQINNGATTWTSARSDTLDYSVLLFLIGFCG